LACRKTYYWAVYSWAVDARLYVDRDQVLWDQYSFLQYFTTNSTFIYVLNVQVGGTYNITVMAATDDDGQSIEIKIDSILIGTALLPNTNDWNKVGPSNTLTVQLSAGLHGMRVRALSDNMNILSYNFTGPFGPNVVASTTSTSSHSVTSSTSAHNPSTSGTSSHATTTTGTSTGAKSTSATSSATGAKSSTTTVTSSTTAHVTTATSSATGAPSATSSTGSNSPSDVSAATHYSEISLLMLLVIVLTVLIMV